MRHIDVNKFNRAVALQERLEGAVDNKNDQLSRYRLFLEKQGFICEDKDGYPTEIVYDESMIKAYIEEATK